MASERRLHPLSFLFAIQDSARQFLVPAIVALFAARGSDSEATDVWAAIVIVPLALVALSRALSVRYRFEPTELVVRSGFIFRRVRHIPYDRIQNVDAVQNVFHRALGVIEVRVETGGGTETEGVLRVVDGDALKEIRARVFADRSGAQPVETPAGADILLAMPAQDVLLFGLVYGRGTVAAGALFGVLWELGIIDRAGGDIVGGDKFGRGAVRQLVNALFDGGALPLREFFTTFVGIAVLIGVFRLASALWTFLTYYGFTLTRSGDDLRSEYGLLTRVASTIPVRRIQKLTVREGPWHRLGRWVSVGVQTAGGTAKEDAGSAKSWLAPLVRQAELTRLLDGIVPEATATMDWQPVHPRGVRREFVKSMVLVLPATTVLTFWIGWWSIGAFLILAGWSLLHARRSVAALRWAVSGETVQFARGWISRSRLVAPLAKVQAVSRHESPFDRRHGMASLFIDTAGQTLAGYAIRIPYLSAPIARALGQQLATAAARTSFRW